MQDDEESWVDVAGDEKPGRFRGPNVAGCAIGMRPARSRDASTSAFRGDEVKVWPGCGDVGHGRNTSDANATRRGLLRGVGTRCTDRYFHRIRAGRPTYLRHGPRGRPRAGGRRLIS